MSNGSIILFADEKHLVRGLTGILESEGQKAEYLDPTRDITVQLSPNPLKALIYEPFFAFRGAAGDHYRPTLNSLIERANNEGAVKIAWTSQEESSLKEEGFKEGTHYDHYLQKPCSIKELQALLPK